MTEVNLPQPFPCTECQAGMMRLEFMTYFTWLDDELVSVPNFPAWVCDVCGRREYDTRAISWLNMLLSPTAGKPAKEKHHRKAPLPKRRLPRPTSPDSR